MTRSSAAVVAGLLLLSVTAGAADMMVVGWQHETIWVVSGGNSKDSSKWKPLNTYASLDECQRGIVAANMGADRTPWTHDNPILGRVTSRYVVNSPTKGEIVTEPAGGQSWTASQMRIFHEYVCLPAGTQPPQK